VVISAQFSSSIDAELGARPLGPAAANAVERVKEKPLSVPATRRLPPGPSRRVREASATASADAFHLGVGIAGLLMIAGGAVAGFGIVNPERRLETVPAGGAATAGECGHAKDTEAPQPPPAPIAEPT